MPVRIAVIYYSATGNVHDLARAIAQGPGTEGADVRLRRVTELAPDAAIDANPAWRAHADATAHIEVATHAGLEWADAYAFGTPTRFGNVSSQLKQFPDTAGPLWAAGTLTDKAATTFTCAVNTHGGNEATILVLYTTMHHWGAITVPPGYTSPAIGAAGGNPYGTSHPSSAGRPGTDALTAAR